MKITLETTKKITKELEVKLPYYSRYSNLFFYKVIAENLTIKVTTEFDGNCQVELTKYLIDSAFREGTIEITETEFREVLIKVTENLINI